MPATTPTSQLLKDYLTRLGYQCQLNGLNFEFSKETNLEDALKELQPIFQSLCPQSAKDLTLVETHDDLAMRSIYEHGRIIREFPRGS